MLKILVISLSFAFTINLGAQETAEPAFITTTTLDWLDKESIKFNGYLKDLKAAQENNDRTALRQAEVRMKTSLENIVFKNQFLETQLFMHLDKERVQKLKENWVDGVGFLYDLNLASFRKTPGLTEIAVTQSQYQEFLICINKLESISAAYKTEIGKSRVLDHDTIAEFLNNAAQLVKTNQSILVQ